MAKRKAAPMLITALLLSTLQTFIPGSAVNVKIGVPENYDGIFPWYLSKLHNLPSNSTDLVLAGDDEGIFGVDAQFLYAIKPLDREKQPSYSLQVSFRPADVPQNIRSPVHRQSFTVEVFVIDKNDNVPAFIEASMRGSVQLGLLKGIPFMQVEALDRDDRNTAHAELRFSLMEQTPRIPSSQMFFINSITGEVSLTDEALVFPFVPLGQELDDFHTHCSLSAHTAVDFLMAFDENGTQVVGNSMRMFRGAC